MTNKPLIPLVIDRARWLRGDEHGSVLLNGDGAMCCLGFACLAAGFSEDDIMATARPDEIRVIPVPNWSVEDCERAMGVNDSGKVSDVARERALKPILKRLGFAVTFTGEGHP